MWWFANREYVTPQAIVVGFSRGAVICALACVRPRYRRVVVVMLGISLAVVFRLRNRVYRALGLDVVVREPGVCHTASHCVWIQ